MQADTKKAIAVVLALVLTLVGSIGWAVWKVRERIIAEVNESSRAEGEAGLRLREIDAQKRVADPGISN